MEAIVSQTGGTFLDRIVEMVIPSETVLFLNTELYRNSFILINRWSFIHLGMGALFYLWKPKSFKLWLKLNIVFEIIELLLAFGGNPLFVEEAIDILLDVVLGLSGFLLMQYFSKGLYAVKKTIKGLSN